MPPKLKIKREEILETAVDIVRKEGFQGLNARKIASLLNCSIQPIFLNFKNMELLKQEVLNQIIDIYHHMMLEGIQTEKPYKGMGLAYIHFAQKEPKLFQALFLEPTEKTAERYMIEDPIFAEILKQGQTVTKLDQEKMQKFHLNMWIFTHGIASFIASGTWQFEEEQISQMLTEMFLGQLQYYQKGNSNEQNHRN